MPLISVEVQAQSLEKDIIWLQKKTGGKTKKNFMKKDEKNKAEERTEKTNNKIYHKENS